jgi:small subunit ribosomal protein S6
MTYAEGIYSHLPTAARTCTLLSLVYPLKCGCLSVLAQLPAEVWGDYPRKEEYHAMRNYELTVIIPSDVADDDVNGVVTTVQGWIEEQGGNVAEVKNWGRKHLAYPIADFREGTYVLFNTNLEAKGINEIERNLKLSQQVIRYLLIRADE